MSSNHAIILATTFLWLGLGIGRLVFHALNIVEWILLLAILINLFLRHGFAYQSFYLWLFIPTLILVLQTIWVLPVLDARAEMHIAGDIVPPSKIHLVYVLFELIKVGSLLTFGIKLFKKYTL